MDNIFNKSVFNDKNPFLKQVFKKQFDAYFFLDFPSFNEFNSTTDHNIPVAFLNNIKQDTIFIDNLNEKKRFQFTFSQNWLRYDFITSFDRKLKTERFLFWFSKNEKWAMISDAEMEIAIIGIDWDIADQVRLFYENSLISPLKSIEKLNIKEFQSQFIDNFKPSKNLTLGNDQNPIWEKYFFDCHVEDENDKLFYWKQFEPLYFTLTKALKDFKGIDMYADQIFWRQYYKNKQWYSAGKSASVGGWQNYNFKNCQKVATKFLTDNQHLRLQFERKHEEADKLVRESEQGLISFMSFWIYANIDKQKQKGYKSDFYFKILGFRGKKDEINQQFEFYYNAKLIEPEDIKELITGLTEIGRAKKIYKTTNPYIFAKYTLDRPLEIYSMNNLTLNYGDTELFDPK